MRAKFHHRMQADEFRVLTGFNGTGDLLPGLTAIGLAFDAAQTLLNEESPGWGAMVKLGATTIWEHWDGKKADGTFLEPNVNSFNHYTFGGCGEWMMGYLVGLRAETPGLKAVHVEPVIVPGLTMADGVPHSGHRSGVARRSYPHLTHDPLARRCARRSSVTFR